MSLLEGSLKRCTNDIPTESRGRAKKFRVTSVQSVPLRVGDKLEEFDESEETEN